MKISIPTHTIALGYAQERIVLHLQKNGQCTANEIYKLSSKQTKPLKQLIDKGVIYKTIEGKYKLREMDAIDKKFNFVVDVALDEYYRRHFGNPTIQLSQRIRDIYGVLLPEILKDLGVTEVPLSPEDEIFDNSIDIFEEDDTIDPSKLSLFEKMVLSPLSSKSE